MSDEDAMSLLAIVFRFVVPDDRIYDVRAAGISRHREVRVYDFELNMLLWHAPFRGPLNSRGARTALSSFLAKRKDHHDRAMQ